MRTWGAVFALAIAGFSVMVFMQVKPHFAVPPVPQLEDTWWGHGSPSKKDAPIESFEINVPDKVLKDLQQRLTNISPLQPPLEGIQQQYGMNSKLFQTVIDFWKTQYNWTEREKFLNQYPQFKVNIQGLNIHYIHVKPASSNQLKVVPLLLLHGWPGSVREFYELIPLLTRPSKGKDFVFEVIVPSLPGYGFSDAAVRPGLGPIQMAVVFKNLMKRLGYEKYYIQGGDWGGIIIQHMARLYPEKIIGVHSNICMINTPLSYLKAFLGSFFPSLIVSKEFENRMYPLSESVGFVVLESGYLHIQATKPDTVGIALRDSPAGLAAYILEKFTTWTNREWKNLESGGLTKRFSLTNLLDNVMIYWVTGSITTSMRLYSEAFNKDQLSYQMDKIPLVVPCGCATFKHEIFYQSESILKEIYTNLVHLSDNDGGHFAAFEVPDVLAQDIYTFVKKVESAKKK